MDRKTFDSAWERIFSQPDENGVVVEENGDAPPCGHPEEPTFGMHPCDVADTMTQGFKDQRSRA